MAFLQRDSWGWAALYHHRKSKKAADAICIQRPV
jgi:hypothetical protein